MMVYRDARHSLAPAAELAALDRLPPADRIEALIRFGELEAAVVDARLPEADDLDPVADAFRATGEALAAWALGAGARPSVAALGAAGLPARADVRTHEGFAWYALHPRAHAAAAGTALARAGFDRAVVVGLRGIGTTLASVVAGTLRAAGVATWSCTVRPRGHPFDRRPAIGPGLARRIRDDPDAMVLVVDEGPGISGSSLCGTAAALVDLDVAEARVLLLPAWIPDGRAFASPAARRRWDRHVKVAAPLERAWFGVPATAEDWSGGGWRDRLLPDPADRPPVHPHQDRLMFRDGDRLLRFTGLGAGGRAAAARARVLAEAGFSPPVVGHADGMTATGWMEGRPLRPADGSPAVLGRIADYLVHRAVAHRTGAAVDSNRLLDLLRANATALLGPHPALERLDRWRPTLAAGPAVAIDGRMEPHHWIATSRGWLKTGGADHADGHLGPGPTDPAWDLAATAVGFGLDAATTGDLAAAIAARTGDRSLARRLPVLTAAVLGFRAAHARLAILALGDGEEGRRFAGREAAARRALAAALDRLADPGPVS